MRNIWFGTSLKWKYCVLLVLALALQIFVPLGPITHIDILAAPLSAAIWMAVGLALYYGFAAARRTAIRGKDFVTAQIR